MIRKTINSVLLCLFVVLLVSFLGKIYEASQDTKATSELTTATPVPATPDPTPTSGAHTVHLPYVVTSSSQESISTDIRAEADTTRYAETIYLGDGSGAPTNVVAMKPIIEFLVATGEFGNAAHIRVSEYASDLDVPPLGTVGPPCTTGSRSWVTGYYYNSSRHLGLDLACSDMNVGAATDAVIYAILYEESDSQQWWSSGVTVIYKAGNVFFGNGHMPYDGVSVTVGQLVKRGDLIGKIGSTGNSTGPHNHYFVCVESQNGSVSCQDPMNYNAIGVQGENIQAEGAVFDKLSESYAQFIKPYDQLPFVKLVPLTETVVAQSRTENQQYAISGESCGMTIEDGIALAFLVSQEYGQSFSYVGPLIASESGFKFFVPDGNGGCKVIQNYAGAPAFCAGQIYQPNGWGGNVLHAQYDLYPEFEGSVDSLQNPVYCMRASMDVYAGFGGNSVYAAARYKGFSSKNDPNFVANYMPAYNSGGVWVRDVFYPFSDDEKLKQLLSNNIENMKKLIEDFKSKTGS